MSTRRNFLKLSLALGASLAGAPVLARATPRERALTLYNTHTGEHLRATYWAEGEYVAAELSALNRLLRDHRSGTVHPIDRELFEMLHALEGLTGARGEFHVISGYRSPQTNAMLRAHSDGVAKSSLHTRGSAIDIRLPGTGLRDLHRAALQLRAGGVGYYPGSDFIHLDTGRVRAW
jgi:uncharacterized protein YcbK (DUF882 family)